LQVSAVVQAAAAQTTAQQMVQVVRQHKVLQAERVTQMMLLTVYQAVAVVLVKQVQLLHPDLLKAMVVMVFLLIHHGVMQPVLDNFQAEFITTQAVVVETHPLRVVLAAGEQLLMEQQTQAAAAQVTAEVALTVVQELSL
jgi:hypothetical protein